VRLPASINHRSACHAQRAFNLAAEPDRVRERYGRHHFGQSCLLARRLVEARVSLAPVPPYRC
jgi:hypothetical protein